MRILNNIKAVLSDISSIMAREFRAISTSYAILLVLFGGIFVYGLMYNYMYEPNLIREAPVAVVDKSRSELSREYTRLLNAAPQVEVYTNTEGFPEAKDLIKSGEVIGIIYLPDNFESRVGRGDESVFILYGTTDAFLYYLALQKASMGAMMELNSRYRHEMSPFLPQKDIQQITQTPAISVVGTALYNHTEGYGSYLIPAVLMIIIFQTLLMVIGMLSGGERMNGSIKLFALQGLSMWRMSRIIIGKTAVYCTLYAVFALFLLWLMPVVFNLPDIGYSYEIIMLLIPYLLATSFLGLAASLFFTDSEAPILMIAFFSVGLIFLSGVSYPLELMPWYWRGAHYIVPAAPATLAFVKINSMGASMAEIQLQYIALWIQCVVYFLLACIVYRYNITKALKFG